MEGRRILTFLRPDVLADAYYEDNTLTELSLIPRGKESLLGNIYVGRVKNIAKNIRAAFVEVEGGMICYLPLEDVQEPVWACMKKGEQLAEGDLLLVQVSREAVKSKAPSVTTNLNLSGKYLVLTTGNRRMGYSSRFSAEEKERLKALTGQWAEDDAGWIVRTNAAKACSKELEMEHRRLLSQYEYLRTRAVHRLACSCVWKSRPPYLDTILGSRENILQEILTDDTDLYAQIRQFMEEEMPEDLEKLRLYEDRMLPLKAMYRLEKGLEEALKEKVWLKSGAYLVIEPTEALTVIDVNTGKFTGGKQKEDTIRKINREAAQEIARQLRLRNLSGIILVDFIDMALPEDRQELLEEMRRLLRRDPQKAAAVDLTPLGLMELTRKKKRKTLKEQAKECGIL